MTQTSKDTITMAAHRLLANGASTDHPISGLPFADDTHLGAPALGMALAARPAWTRDPSRAGFVWVVHSDRHLGRIVLLYEAGPDGSGPWEWQTERPLVARAGGYWWDGTRWFRPPQLCDETTGRFERQPVPAASTITAAGLLDDPLADAGRGRLHQVADLREDAAPDTGQWLHDLARWATQRRPADGRPPLERCVVGLTAPELAGDRLLGAPALAKVASISPSALRAYISRGQGSVPEPQAVVGGRPMWSRAVAENWAAHRRRPPATRWPAHHARQALPKGAEQIRRRLTPALFAALWHDPERRARWVLRHRTRDAVHEVAADLAHLAAERLHDDVPAPALAELVTQAVLANLATGQVLSGAAEEVLGWLSLYHPDVAEQSVTAIAEQAELRFRYPRQDTIQLLRAGLPGAAITPAGTVPDRE
ncbi:hypothetical protein [Streptomyces violascens]|uniref:hypothetical protein n=1 Tax=Streptomyces violascens TaxID=67381 RepID=UPI001674CA96|nr:hypothetical protein [Streptomyces violascens]GGU39469.1 hypothetical protein GCM10010289_70520 [Streptomyces violascens]